MVIYSKRLNAEPVPFFYGLLPEDIKENIGDYDLRPGAEWDSPATDRSLSRCIENRIFKAFDFLSYKLSATTPRMPNACDESFSYILVDRSPDLQDVEQPMDAHMHLDDLNSNENEPPQLKRQRIVEEVDQDVQLIEELTPSASSNPDSNENRRALNFYKSLENKFQITCSSLSAQIISVLQRNQEPPTCSPEEKNIFPWMDTTHWTNAQKDLLKTAFDNKLKLTESQKGWVVLYATDDPTNPNFGCKLCREHYLLNKERYQNNPKKLNNFAQERGTSYPDISTQEKAAFWKKTLWAHEHPFAHSKTDMGSHPRIILQLTNIYTKKKSTSLMEAEQVLQDEKRNTLKMFRTAYMLIKKNIPFNLFPNLVQLQQQNGGIPNKVLHANRRSLSRIVNITAISMKNSIVTTILTAKPPLSIIVDSSTDPQSRQYLLLYLQFTYKMKQECVLYRVLLLESETAQSMLEVIMKAFQEDKLEAVIKDTLVAFVADGASVMQGQKGGLGVLLEQWANWAAVETPGQQVRKRVIHKIHCAAHRLQLAVSHVVTKDGVMKTLQADFESTINGVHSFYHRHAPKRRASLYLYASTWKVSIHQLKSIFKVRWLSSQYAAINSLHRNYFVILFHLQQVAESLEFDVNTKQLAVGFYRKLSTIDFYLYLLFQMDCLKPLSIFSEILQTDFYSLSNLNDDLENTVLQIQELESKNEFHVHHFLFDAQCKKDEEIMPCSLDLIEDTAVEISLKMESFFPKTMPEAKFTFRRRNTNKFKLSSFRTRIIPKLVNSLKEYFPVEKELLKKLAYLNPDKIPTGTGTVPQYAYQLKLVFEKFGSAVTQATNEMVDAVNYLVMHDKENYFKMKKESMVKFWQYAVATVKPHRQIGELQKVIETILSIPPGSVIVERGFSIFFYSKNPRRSQLSTASLQNIMQILVNGPPPEAYNPLPAVNLWIEKKGKLSDDAFPSNDPNTGLLPAPLLPPERFVNDDRTEIFEFEDDEDERLSALDDIAFPEASTFADDAEDIEYIYPVYDI